MRNTWEALELALEDLIRDPNWDAPKPRRPAMLRLIDRFGGRCISCGSVDSLVFDHIDPTTKKFEISSGLLRLDLEDELRKCQLLCRSCHGRKTVADRMRLRMDTQTPPATSSPPAG